ncbi:MAG: ABC transporter ATP-binding protein [Acidimicrobiia bacterium]
MIDDLTVAYGGAVAVKELSLTVPAGGAVALLGANGAGKSTTLRAISGMLKPSGGTMWFEGERLDGKRPDQLLRRGIAHVLEGRQLFTSMTVRENLEMGATARGRSTRDDSIDQIFSRFAVLKEKEHQPAAQLSGGQQQMLAIARAVMSRPRLLLLDEPSLGLAPIMLPVVMDLVRWAQETLGATVLLVEQFTALAMQVAPYSYVLRTGSLALEGPSDDLRDSDALREAYLHGHEQQPRPTREAITCDHEST